MLIGIDASRAVTGQRTGTEAYAFFLIEALVPLTTAGGHQLRLYFNQAPPENLFIEADHVDNVVIPQIRVWTHLRLSRELSRRPPDVFFTPAHVIPYGYHGPSVATVHDLGYHYFPEAHTRRQRVYLRWSTRHNSQRSRRVIADSNATKEDLATHYGIDQGKVDVIYPGIDPSLRPVTDKSQLEQTQAKYGIKAPYLLFIGTLQPRKNLERLIEAYAASGLKHQLVLAGKKGWHAQPIMKQIEAQDNSVQNRILLPGYVEDNDKAALISGASAVVFPSLYEGFGFPVVEGNVCETPVLCANTSSLPEIAGDAALLIDPLDAVGLADGIYRLVRDQSLRDELIQAGRQNARRFSWKRAAEEVLASLRQAIE